eukprot:CAMPEP_0172730734 /NCGR_PEP_ID=MMETSP1074-20121228/99023_1 /TAXON_ID=2916 /ORGANISM="Ceratium fusus, Strain PA161109" /LENGTH=55 /DNA_ID=CAMNT_0013558555 /DNA_START=116 /DNA_END=279 /DNA_ORIENTATION=+
MESNFLPENSCEHGRAASFGKSFAELTKRAELNSGSETFHHSADNEPDGRLLNFL